MNIACHANVSILKFIQCLIVTPFRQIFMVVMYRTCLTSNISCQKVLGREYMNFDHYRCKVIYTENASMELRYANRATFIAIFGH